MEPPGETSGVRGPGALLAEACPPALPVPLQTRSPLLSQPCSLPAPRSLLRHLWAKEDFGVGGTAEQGRL